MKGILKESTIALFANIKNIFRNVAIWTLIGGVVLGMILVVVKDDVNSGEIVQKMMNTFFVMAIAMLISALGAKRVDSENAVVQILALICLAFNAIWFVLWTVCIWLGFNSGNSLSVVDRLALITSILAGFGLIGANVMNIYEGSKKSTVLPLKITTLVCLGITSMHGIVRAATMGTSADSSLGRFDALAVFTGTAFFIVLIVALISSSSEKSKVKSEQRKEMVRQRQQMMQQTMAQNQQLLYEQQQAAAQRVAEEQAARDAKKPKTDDELRAEIEEKVRREMIEKEVREKLEKEAKAKAKK